MTVFPDRPVLVDKLLLAPAKVLADDHVTEVSLFFGLYHVRITVQAGFFTDGASVPEILRPVAGGPWDMPRLLAALPHDGLYHLHWKWRWLCDRIYLAILLKAGYPAELANIEYAAIRAAGGRNWNAVTETEKRHAKRCVTVQTWGLLS